jgi:hypothetical protein
VKGTVCFQSSDNLFHARSIDVVSLFRARSIDVISLYTKIFKSLYFSARYPMLDEESERGNVWELQVRMCDKLNNDPLREPTVLNVPQLTNTSRCDW